MPSAAENKQIKRKKILDSAFNLFSISSVTSTAVDDIVRMAGVAKGTFYLYFKDKYDLLDQIVIYKSAELLANAIKFVKSNVKSNALNDMILCMVSYVCDFLEKNKNFTTLLDKKLSLCVRAFFSGESEEYSSIGHTLVSQFVANGYSERDAQMTIYLITDLVGSVMCDAVMGNIPFNMNEIKEYLKNSVFKMLEA